MTWACATFLRCFSPCWLALPLAGASLPSQLAAPPARDSLTISGVVRSHTGLRQPRARVRVILGPRMARSSPQTVGATWTNQQGFFLLKISLAEAADSLLIRATCRAQPRSTGYLLGAEKFVDIARQRPYTIWLKKRRIYLKAR